MSASATMVEDPPTRSARSRMLLMPKPPQERLVKLTDEVRESARAAGIARARYREGVADFLSLLDAERTDLPAEDGAAQAEAEVFTAFVSLCRALGGMQ